MKGLQYLDLSSNKLTGPLPIEMYALTKLEVLLLNSNQIDGAVMGATGNWEALHVALLDGMELRGNLSPMCEFISAERNELLYADCDGDTPFVECSCCKCCVSGQSGCSRDYVADLDKRLEYVYRTSDFISLGHYAAKKESAANSNVQHMQHVVIGIQTQQLLYDKL
jgi:hypothetical protein